VQSAVADAIKAREDQTRLKNEAEAYANERVPKARGAGARQVAEAIGDREQRVVEAQGDTVRFTKLLAEYRKAPRVTRDRLYLETMSEVLSHATKIVVDVGKNGPAIYLPLEQLRKDAAGDAGTGEPPAPAAGAPRAGAQSDSRSRERGGR
jgi:membrane protease subunit HflK